MERCNTRFCAGGMLVGLFRSADPIQTVPAPVKAFGSPCADRWQTVGLLGMKLALLQG